MAAEKPGVPLATDQERVKMNISDLKNPAAAAAVLKEFKKRFNAKVCLAPIGDCGGGVISAHTLSVGAMLKPIAKDGHVYAIKSNLFKPPGEALSFDLVGLRETSVFYGFCSVHDKSLFAPVEDKTFACTPEQLFIYAYRAVAKESYLKRKQSESIPSIEDLKKIHGMPDGEEYAYHPDVLMYLIATIRGAEEIERLKIEMDLLLQSDNWRRIVTTVIPFKKTVPITCSFVFTPDCDFLGNSLQDLSRLDLNLSQLMVSLLPSQSGGYALLSRLDTANSAPRRLIESLVLQADVTSGLAWLIFCQTENFALSPTWFESLSDTQKEAIKEAFFGNILASESPPSRLMDCKLKIETWEPGKTFTL